MEIGIFRDFIIVIGGFLFIFTVILAAILGFMLYRQFKKVTTSVKETMNTAKQMGSEVKQAFSSMKDIPIIFKAPEKSERKIPVEPKI